MDRQALEQQRQQVKTDLVVANEHVERQRQIVADLELSGKDSAAARLSLQEAVETQAVYAAEADRLAGEIGTAPVQTEKAGDGRAHRRASVSAADWSTAVARR
jgi:hypothetical protein